MHQVIISCGNLFALAGALVHFRIPFTFIPNSAYCNSENKCPFGHSVIEADIDDRYMKVDEIRQSIMQRSNGRDFGFRVLQDIE